MYSVFRTIYGSWRPRWNAGSPKLSWNSDLANLRGLMPSSVPMKQFEISHLKHSSNNTYSVHKYPLQFLDQYIKNKKYSVNESENSARYDRQQLIITPLSTYLSTQIPRQSEECSATDPKCHPEIAWACPWYQREMPIEYPWIHSRSIDGLDQLFQGWYTDRLVVERQPWGWTTVWLTRRFVLFLPFYRFWGSSLIFRTLVFWGSHRYMIHKL